MHIGKYVFAQITQFLPQRQFRRFLAKYDDRTKGWTMSHWNHMLVLMFGLKIGRSVVEVMRILGKSALTKDNIHDLPRPLKQEAENPDDGQLYFDFKFD